jgi:hypothetical protein
MDAGPVFSRGGSLPGDGCWGRRAGFEEHLKKGWQVLC